MYFVVFIWEKLSAVFKLLFGDFGVLFCFFSLPNFLLWKNFKYIEKLKS